MGDAGIRLSIFCCVVVGVLFNISLWIMSTIIFCWQFSQLLLLLVVDQISNGWNERVTTKGLGLCFQQWQSIYHLCFQGVYTCINSPMLCKGILLFYWCSLNKFTIITMLFLEMNSAAVYVEYVIYLSRITHKLCREKSTMLLEFTNFITLFFAPKFSKPIL